jgi:hypothetical protein
VVDDLADEHRLVGHAQCAAVEVRLVEQVLDEAMQPTGLRLDAVQQACTFVVREAGAAPLQRPREMFARKLDFIRLSSAIRSAVARSRSDRRAFSTPTAICAARATRNASASCSLRSSRIAPIGTPSEDSAAITHS